MSLKNNNGTVIWYLEMLSINEFKGTRLPIEANVVKQEIPLASVNKFFYNEVGKFWKWNSRIKWSDEDWIKWVQRDELETWILLFKGTLAGYYELNTFDNDVEIAYFGLLSQFIGLGLGGGLLSVAIENAWKKEKDRIWVHTCNLDHPNALRNYQDRGFKIYKETKE